MGFPNLISLDKEGLQHLTSLQRLLILNCPELKCMPEDGLPASLSALNIYGSPLLEKEGIGKKEKNGARFLTSQTNILMENGSNEL